MITKLLEITDNDNHEDNFVLGGVGVDWFTLVNMAQTILEILNQHGLGCCVTNPLSPIYVRTFSADNKLMADDFGEVYLWVNATPERTWYLEVLDKYGYSYWTNQFTIPD